MMIIVDRTMAVLASRSWTGFVVNNSHVASQEFNRNAQEGRGRQRSVGMERLPAIANGEIRYRLKDWNGKTL
ncbi:FixH family protein [Mesorhizobium sp. M0984]|uniref:FixH family protein n=1 Tax=unclassified Mesorhizobium TaxID=325217 RepID=UPI003337FAB4